MQNDLQKEIISFFLKEQEQRDLALRLHAEGKLSKKQICHEVGISQKTLFTWVEGYEALMKWLREENGA
jgi:transposase-like protein